MEIFGPRTAAASYRPAPVYRMTNFYPLYDGDNDQVDSVSAVKGVAFQKVIPRYRLSTSETRDQGTGPAFEEISTSGLPVMVRGTNQSYRMSNPAPLDLFQGNKIDLFA